MLVKIESEESMKECTDIANNCMNLAQAYMTIYTETFIFFYGEECMNHQFYA